MDEKELIEKCDQDMKEAFESFCKETTKRLLESNKKYRERMKKEQEHE